LPDRSNDEREPSIWRLHCFIDPGLRPVTLDDFVEHVYVLHRARSIGRVMRRRQVKYWTAEDAVQDAALEIVARPALIAEYPPDGGDDRNWHGTPYWWLNLMDNAGRLARYHRDHTTELPLENGGDGLDDDDALYISSIVSAGSTRTTACRSIANPASTWSTSTS
jgi:hypothetical protein